MTDSPFFSPEAQSEIYRAAVGCPFLIVIFLIAYLIAKELNKKR
jgi:hypothetical protein